MSNNKNYCLMAESGDIVEYKSSIGTTYHYIIDSYYYTNSNDTRRYNIISMEDGARYKDVYLGIINYKVIS